MLFRIMGRSVSWSPAAGRDLLTLPAAVTRWTSSIAPGGPDESGGSPGIEAGALVVQGVPSRIRVDLGIQRARRRALGHGSVVHASGADTDP